MKKLMLYLGLLVLAITPVCAGDKIKVISLSSILTEIAREVGGTRVEVVALVKPGMDPHEFEPKPVDLKQVAQSQLVLAIGRNMEGYLPKLQQSAGAKGSLLEVGNKIPALKMAEHHDHSHAGHDHHHGGDDPHWWHSVENVQRAAKLVRDALVKISPEAKDEFFSNTQAYLAKLEALKKWAKRKVAELPRDRRKLVTSHDAFQYFARENGFTIYAVEGISSEQEASNRKAAEIIDVIQKQKVKAVFIENTQNPKVLQEITRETGAKIGGVLYSEGLGEGELSTYEGMVKHNVTTIVDALK